MRKILNYEFVSPQAPVDIADVQLYTTEFIPVDSFNSYGFQLAFTGSPVGTVTVEFSFDDVPFDYKQVGASPPFQPTVFDTVPNTTIDTSTVSTGVITLDVLETNATWIRLKWDNTSGSGTITSLRAVLKGKQI